MARILKGSPVPDMTLSLTQPSQGISQFYLHTPHSSSNRMNHSRLAFPVEAGPRLPTPEGWKIQLAWVAGYILR